MDQTGEANKITAIVRPNGYISRFPQGYLRGVHDNCLNQDLRIFRIETGT